MKITILGECGYELALLGLSLSYGQSVENMAKVALKLCNKDSGHNKFLESISVWIDITAPRYFWQEFDTYRVGMTKQSESTIHTVLKQALTQDDFQYEIPEDTLYVLNDFIKEKNALALKNLLPEGFLQRRIVCTNYKSLRNIILQRKGHVLKEWQLFCNEIMSQLEHPGLLGIPE